MSGKNLKPRQLSLARFFSGLLPKQSIMILRLIVALASCTLVADSAAAQSLLSSGETAPDGGRPKSTQVGFFELMESGGDALLDSFKPSRQEYSVESPEYDSQASPRGTVLTFV